MELIVTTSAIYIAFLLLMQVSRYPLRTPHVLSGRKYAYPKGLFVAAFLTLTFVAAFRQGFVDTRVYKMLYEQIGTDWNNAFNDTIPTKDYGFSLLMILLNRINSDPQFLVIVTSLITMTAYIVTLGKYADDVPFSFFLFLCVAYLGCMNGIRQVLAGALLTLAFPWLRDKKWIPFCLLVLLLSTFHASVLVMIPLCFIISGKRMNWGIWIYLGLIAMCFIAPNAAYQAMETILEDSIYADYLENESKMGVMRFLVALVPAILAFLYCWIQKGNHAGENKHCENYTSQRMIDILINMEIVEIGFIALGLRMVYFARISMYFTCVMPLLLPVAISGVFTKKSAQIVKRLAILMYLFYFAYQIYSYENYGYFYDFYLVF